VRDRGTMAARRLRLRHAMADPLVRCADALDTAGNQPVRIEQLAQRDQGRAMGVDAAIDRSLPGGALHANDGGDRPRPDLAVHRQRRARAAQILGQAVEHRLDEDDIGRQIAGIPTDRSLHRDLDVVSEIVIEHQWQHGEAPSRSVG
jgi:hypothetical protein